MILLGILDAKRFIELASKSNGFSQTIVEGCLQAITDELQHRSKQDQIVEAGALGYFSLSLKCDHSVMEEKETRSSSIHLDKVNLRINKKFRENMEPLPLERMKLPYRGSSSPDEDKCPSTLVQHLDKQDCIICVDLTRLADISRYKATILLNICLERRIIREYGGGGTVVCLKRQSVLTGVMIIEFVKDFCLKRVVQLFVKNQLDINKVGYIADYPERCHFNNNLGRFGHSLKKYMEQLFRAVGVSKTFPVLEESFHHYFL